MRRRFGLFSAVNLNVPAGGVGVRFGAAWLVIAPCATWGIRVIYMPLAAPALGPTVAWLAAATCTILAAVGVYFHALAHIAAARAAGAPVPRSVPVYPLGDSAQAWPRAPSARADIGVALAGPLAQIALAGIAYLVWNFQVNPFANGVALFLVFLYAGTALANLAPGFPFDGGRLIRALGHPDAMPYGLGAVSILGVFGWAGFLASQHARFSFETGLSSVVVGALAAWQLTPRRPAPGSAVAPSRIRRWRLAATFPLAAAMAAIAAMLLPTNHGLEAPGIAASVEPMVHVPSDLSHHVDGTFILTTVIPQAPIVAGEWVYAHFDSAVRLTTPEEIVPADTTAHELAIQGFRDLQESEKTAIVVGLNMAGYEASLTYHGVEVVGILSTSGAHGVLRLRDEIVAVNGQPVTTTSDVSRVLGESPDAGTATIDVLRGSETVQLPVQLTATPDGPKIGINISPTGDTLDIPFPVTITPEKIDGGPSAGLMFALTVYNALTPDDLTGGKRVAGTGTISLDGAVGPIGGVQQKVAAAERAGAEYFLAPSDNYQDAVAVARNINVVRIASAREAIDFLNRLP